MNKKNIILLAIIIMLIVFITFLSKKGKVSLKTQAVASASGLFETAKKADSKGDLLETKKAYQRILSTATDNKIITKAQSALSDVNMRIIFSSLETDSTLVYEVLPKDSLQKIANKFKTTVALIKRSNNLSTDTIRPGQHLRLWKGKFSCIVDKSQNILTLKSDDEVVKVYRVATGKNNSTPVGKFSITSKLENPVWYKQGAVVLPGSPDNILGSRWLGFSLAGYGIHGTTDPQSIGRQVTAGCVRMSNSDVEELFDILPLGTEVTVID
ncbi:MAG: L,D-transpeptidase family protein [Candidatus Omnitrophota bacterium]